MSKKQRASYAEKESTIERQILMELMRREHRGDPLMFWKVKSTGTYDPKIQRFRSTPPWYRKGAPDIHGFYRGTPVVIEVKTATGQLSPDQREFKATWVKQSRGFYAVCRSVDDVAELFAHIDKQLNGSSTL